MGPNFDFSLTIQEIDLEDVPEIIYEVDYDDVLQIRQFQELIKDRSTTLAQSIIDICKIINLNEFQKIIMKILIH